MELFLGVDGGQSATKVVVGDRNARILSRGQAGPCNHVGAQEGRRKLMSAIQAAVSQALAPLGETLSAVRFAAVCCGMSGGPDDKAAILAELLPTDHIDVTTDADIALLGGSGGDPGVVIIAGTGSIAIARNGRGRRARAGGWGYVFGDEGGAFDLVRQALRAALRQEEGWGPPTALRGALLAATGASSANELLHAFYTSAWPRSRVAALLPEVTRAADQGDDTAHRLLASAGEALLRFVLAARDQVFSDAEIALVTYAGGAFQAAGVRSSFQNALAGSPQCRFQEPQFEPAIGALLRAYDLAGVRQRGQDLSGV